MRSASSLITLECLLILAGLAMLALASPAIAIRLSRTVFMAGNGITLTCTVRPDAKNRRLEYGIVNFAEHSQRDLHGEAGPRTTQVVYDRVPCGSGPAYCAVLRSDGSQDLAQQPFEVVGCEP